MLARIKKLLFGGEVVDEKTYLDLRGAVQDGGLDVRSAIAAHIAWKEKLLEQLAGGGGELDPNVICQDNRCALGQWIYGAAAARLGKFQGLTVLRINHQMFHHIAAQVVELHQAGEDDKAREILEKNYAFYSEKVCADLEKLSEIVSK